MKKPSTPPDYFVGTDSVVLASPPDLSCREWKGRSHGEQKDTVNGVRHS